MLTGRRVLSKTTIDTDYISLAHVKTWLRVTNDLEDSIISSLISAAIGQVSDYVGYSIVEASVKYGFDSLIGSEALDNPFLGIAIPQGNYLRIPSKVNSITSVKYIDSANVEQPIDYIQNEFTDYVLTLVINSAPSSLTLGNTKYVVQVVEGYDVESFPDQIRTAVCLLVAQYYDNRQAIVVGTIVEEMPLGVSYLLDPFKIYTFV